MRRVGKVAFWTACGGVVLPMAGGMATAMLFGLPLYWEGIFVGAILTATSVSISAQTLMEIGALRTREGATTLGAAVIDDVMGIIVLSFVVAFARASASGVELGGVALVVIGWQPTSPSRSRLAGSSALFCGGRVSYPSRSSCSPPLS